MARRHGRRRQAARTSRGPSGRQHAMGRGARPRGMEGEITWMTLYFSAAVGRASRWRFVLAQNRLPRYRTGRWSQLHHRSPVNGRQAAANHNARDRPGITRGVAPVVNLLYARRRMSASDGPPFPQPGPKSVGRSLPASALQIGHRRCARRVIHLKADEQIDIARNSSRHGFVITALLDGFGI